MRTAMVIMVLGLLVSRSFAADVPPVDPEITLRQSELQALLNEAVARQLAEVALRKVQMQLQAKAPIPEPTATPTTAETNKVK